MPEAYFHLAIAQCAQILQCDDAMLYVWNADRQRLVARAATDRHRDFERAIELALGDGIVGWSALNQEPVLLADFPAQDLRFRLVPDIDEVAHRSFIAVPLADSSGTVKAVIAARHLAPSRFSEHDVAALSSVGKLILHTLANDDQSQDQVVRDDQALGAQAIGEAGTSEALQAHEAINIIARQLANASDSDLVLVASAQIANRPYLEARGLGVRSEANLPDVQIGQLSAAAVAAAAGSRRSLRRDEAPELFASLGARSVQSIQFVLALPLQARGLGLGTVLVFRRDGAEADEHQTRRLQHLVTQAALAIAVIDLTTDPDERRAERRLLEILFSGDDRVALQQRLANEVDFDMGADHAVAYGRLSSDMPGLGAQVQMQTLERLIRRTLPGSLCDLQMHGVRAVVPLSGQTPVEVASRLGQALADRPGPTIGYVGISDPISSAVSTTRGRHWTALQEATLAARLCQGANALSLSETGPTRFLLPVLDSAPPGALEQRLLDMVVTDDANGTELFRTLEVFLSNGCRPTAAARELHLHRNSLSARLGTIAKALDDYPLNETNRLTLEIALHLARLRLATGHVQ